MRILVVDDYAPFAKSLRLLLGKEHTVTLATDGSEALRLLAAGPPFDLILCDLVMEGVSGADVWRALRETGEEKKLIFVTGDTTSPEVASFLAGTGNECLEKPFETERLRQLVRERAAGR